MIAFENGLDIEELEGLGQSLQELQKEMPLQLALIKSHIEMLLAPKDGSQ